jgi:hypothetical protein
MKSSIGFDGGRRSPTGAVRKRKRQNYTSDVYGARLSFEDARILDDYGKANGLDRSNVVRRALHQFALKQQMLYYKKDPLREMTEQVIAEKIDPLYERVEEMISTFRGLANSIAQEKQTGPQGHQLNNSRNESTAQHVSEDKRLQDLASKEQKKILDKIILTTTLALWLQVKYVVDPILRDAEARPGQKHIDYLAAADQVGASWCQTTRKVFHRTGERALFDLKYITREEWEVLLKEPNR